MKWGRREVHRAINKLDLGDELDYNPQQRKQMLQCEMGGWVRLCTGLRDGPSLYQKSG